MAALLLAIVPAGLAFEGEDQDPIEIEGATNKGMDVRFNPGAVHAGRQVGVTGSDTGESGNVQINDPGLDHIQNVFGFAPPFDRPFEFSIQSETSAVAFGDHIVVGYNSSAGSKVSQPAPGVLSFDEVLFSAFSASHDGGRTWTSGFIPPVPGTAETDGDPSLGVDRKGNFYYASIGVDVDGAFGIIVGKSTDRGRSFAPAVMAARDDPGADKEWLAVGRDPRARGRDNVYVAWTSFRLNAAGTAFVASELRFVRSIDGGRTWSAQKVLFAPTADAVFSSFIQFANPVVDDSSGRLYIPFLHFSNSDADFVRVLASDDGGQTFRLLRFNVAGAPDAFAFPNVTPGLLTDCGSPGGGRRLVLHQGPNLGGGRGGLPRFRQSTRLISQPSAAAARGRIFIALNSSTSSLISDPAAGSEIRLLFSLDGGASWRVRTVARANALDRQHVHPSIASDSEGENVHIGYYVQQADERLRTDLLRAEVNDGRVRVEDVSPLSSVAFNLIPSNNPIGTPARPFRTTNYDRLVVACYNIGEYMSVLSGDDPLAAWGDNRNSWTSPAKSPAAGTHAQPDVFAGRGGDE